MAKTIDQFDPARTPYLPSDLFGIGYGTPPLLPTYRGSIGELTAYLKAQIGVDQVTLVGDQDYAMAVADFELATSVTFTSSRTWYLSAASASPKGTRKRVVDLAGSIGYYWLGVSRVGSDTINGINTPWILGNRFASVIFESNGVNEWTVVNAVPALYPWNNLADLWNVVTARTNLGLGTAATQNSNAFASVNNNLSDLSSGAAARSNLGLGTIALLNLIGVINLDPTMWAGASDIFQNIAGKVMYVNGFWDSQVPRTIPYNNGWDFNTFINGEWAIPSTAPATTVVPVPSHVKAGQKGFVIIRNQANVAKTVSWPSPAFNDITTTVATFSFPAGSTNLFEYWAENSSLVWTKTTTMR
jgi:hypothetical protein